MQLLAGIVGILVFSQILVAQQLLLPTWQKVNYPIVIEKTSYNQTSNLLRVTFKALDNIPLVIEEIQIYRDEKFLTQVELNEKLIKGDRITLNLLLGKPITKNFFTFMFIYQDRKYQTFKLLMTPKLNQTEVQTCLQ